MKMRQLTEKRGKDRLTYIGLRGVSHLTARLRLATAELRIQSQTGDSKKEIVQTDNQHPLNGSI